MKAFCNTTVTLVSLAYITFSENVNSRGRKKCSKSMKYTVTK